MSELNKGPLWTEVEKIDKISRLRGRMEGIDENRG